MSLHVTNGDNCLIIDKSKAKAARVAILQVLEPECVELVKTDEDEATEEFCIALSRDNGIADIWPVGEHGASLDSRILKILRLCERGSFISFYDEDENLNVNYAKQSVGMVRERCECAYFEEDECDE